MPILHDCCAAPLALALPRDVRFAGSFTGHALGIVGLLLMAWATFGYTWRKQPGRSGPGSGATAMRLHVATGLLGPALVLLHAGLTPGGLAGITRWLVLVVVASGGVGRFVFTALPREEDDDALRRIDEEIGETTDALRAAGDDGAPHGPWSPSGAAVAAVAADPTVLAARRAGLAAHLRSLHEARAAHGRRSSR
ncbi:MAG TPA: hypothetical protein VEA99_03735, partial [Gemmatimonadaceae bacterium]|nr:hypothetical protein [Gemmatimonadaceae bacterium]